VLVLLCSLPSYSSTLSIVYHSSSAYHRILEPQARSLSSASHYSPLQSLEALQGCKRVSIDMSQQHAFPLPPPPPVTGSPRAETSPYFTQQRRRPGPAQQPPSITTNFLRTQGLGSQAQTPASASSPAHSALSYSPATPSVLQSRTPSVAYSDAGHLLDPSRAHLQSPGSPSMAQQPYNPRQWSGHGSHLAYSQQPSPLSRAAVEVTGMEGTFIVTVAVPKLG
jgi:hypothetical protein